MGQLQGPKINKITTRFSSRDSLGIESGAASISAVLCPTINTVTPRAFYWAFMSWIYYDFHINSGIQKKTSDVFNAVFLKKQDYFFVLANILAENKDRYDLGGIESAENEIRENPDGPYEYNKNYLQVRFGGMQYYNAGCLSMGLISYYDEDTGKGDSMPHPTEYGKKMALAFEEIIKGTRYYQQYRLDNRPVPRDVLIEYGRVIQLSFQGFTKCKELLRWHLFDKKQQQKLSADFAKTIYNDSLKYRLETKELRYYLFDHYSPLGEAETVPDELITTVRGWEVVIGRQYFSAGIEIIWKYMLKSLTQAYSLDEWSDVVLNQLDEAILNDIVDKLIPKCLFTHKIREEMVSRARQSSMQSESVIDGLEIALSVYNRFVNRQDLGAASAFLEEGRGKESICLNDWIELVNNYKNRPVKELLLYIMREYIVKQHEKTCFEKIIRSSQSIDGYYFEKVDGKYIKNEHEFQVDFQGIRMTSLMQVMKDLDMFDDNSSK